jgi:hypothetical protein
VAALGTWPKRNAPRALAQQQAASETVHSDVFLILRNQTAYRFDCFIPLPIMAKQAKATKAK